MDSLLETITKQAVNYAIRSGITIASTFATQSCSRLLKLYKQQDHDKQFEELSDLQIRLQSKMQIIGPSIDMIELIAARGNTNVQCAALLTKSIRADLQSLGAKFTTAANAQDTITNTRNQADTATILRTVIKDTKKVLSRIEDAVPSLNLAITTSGASLSTNLSATVSPSRLLRASTFLTVADAHYGSNDAIAVQVGPTFTMSIYMLFLGHTDMHQDDDSPRRIVWQEVLHKAKIKLVRVPLDRIYEFPYKAKGEDSREPDHDGRRSSRSTRIQEFAYQLVIIEDLNDGRVHTFDDGDPQPDLIDDVPMAGIRELVPIHEVAKIFYADTGKVLNISSEAEANNPVLLLKRDIHASPPKSISQAAAELSMSTNNTAGTEVEGAALGNAQLHDIPRGQWRLPAGLDPEWIALELFAEDEEDDEETDEEEGETDKLSEPSGTMDPILEAAEKRIARSDSLPAILLSKFETSLSLLEMLIRLASLQQFQQISHLNVTDEFLNFFLAESTTTGAVSGDVEVRKRLRLEARSRVGFDPYDESPIKRRGERNITRHGKQPIATDGHEGGLDDTRAAFDALRLESRTPSDRLGPPKAGGRQRSAFSTPPRRYETRSSTSKGEGGGTHRRHTDAEAELDA